MAADEPEAPAKRCRKCRQTKPLAAFTKRRNQRDGLDPWCRECKSRYRSRLGPERTRQYKIRMYGLTRDGYLDLLNRQDGLCAICDGSGDPRLWLDVDHDHSTGVVRGLLCQNCNRGLGHLQEDPALLRRAANYLETATDHRDLPRLFG